LDNKNWKGPIAYGMWPNSNRQRLSAFEPISARYVKLSTKAEATESSWIGISELNLYASLYTIPQGPQIWSLGSDSRLPYRARCWCSGGL
jgi:galactose oxidase